MYRPVWWSDYGGCDLLPMCEGIHGICAGACDDWDAIRLLPGKVRCLKWADAHWEPTVHAEWQAFDDAVRLVVRAAIAEGLAWMKRNGIQEIGE